MLVIILELLFILNVCSGISLSISTKFSQKWNAGEDFENCVDIVCSNSTSSTCQHLRNSCECENTYMGCDDPFPMAVEYDFVDQSLLFAGYLKQRYENVTAHIPKYVNLFQPFTLKLMQFCDKQSYNIYYDKVVFSRKEKCTLGVEYEKQFSELDMNEFLMNNETLTIMFLMNCFKQVRGKFRNTFPHLLSLDLSYNLIGNISQDAFEGLNELETLFLNKNSIKHLSHHHFRDLQSVSILLLEDNCISELEEGMFRYLRNLHSLALGSNLLETLPNRLLEFNKQLNQLDFQDNFLKDLPSDLFRNLINLQEIQLQSNKLSSLPPGLFDDLVKLKEIDLNNNNLMALRVDVFAKNAALNSIQLDSNELRNIPVLKFPPLKTGNDIEQMYLRHISLKGNKISKFVVNEFIRDTFVDLSDNCISVFIPTIKNFTLTRLYCSNCCLDTLSPQLFESVSSVVSISDNNISTISTIDFMSMTHLSFVALTGNPLREIQLNRNVSSFVSEGNTTTYVDLSSDQIICDCHLVGFVRYLQQYFALLPKQRQEHPVQIETNLLFCDQPDTFRGRAVQQVHPDELLCNITSENLCPWPCECYTQSSTESVIVNCSDRSLQFFPELSAENFEYELILLYNGNNISAISKMTDANWNRIKELHLQHNKLSNLDNFKILKSLKTLLLDNNLLTSSEEVQTIIQNLPELRLTLAHNNWECNCQLLNLKSLTYGKTNVLDANDVTCSYPNNDELFFLTNVTSFQLCPYGMSIASKIAIALVVALFFLSVVIVQLYSHREEIKLWLFVHNMCLSCVAEKDVDADKIYDAFVSYSSLDDDWVANVLVPGLEEGTPSYKLCLHQRDWLVGDFIIEQISRSVQQSRRTIIVLTENFVRSDWSRLEFLAAYRQMNKDKMKRILVVVPAAMPNEETLPEELRSFVAMNTYIHWDEPNFWRKLRCSMPRIVQPTRYKKKEKPRLMRPSCESVI